MSNKTLRYALNEKRSTRLNALAANDPYIATIDRLLSLIEGEKKTTSNSIGKSQLDSLTTTGSGKVESFASSFRRAIGTMEGDFTSKDLRAALGKQLPYKLVENSFNAMLSKCRGQEIEVVRPKLGRQPAIYRKKVAQTA